MTDQRDRARVMIAELTGLDTGYDCCLTGESAINVMRTALADAERRVWEAAAGLVEEMYLKPERIWDADTLDGVINKLRAQATQEEG